MKFELPFSNQCLITSFEYYKNNTNCRGKTDKTITAGAINIYRNSQWRDGSLK